jgi:CRP-like cAMP-binding protein
MIVQEIKSFLQNQVLFRDYADNEEFFDSIIRGLAVRIYKPGSYILRKGEEGRAMFFVLKGQVEVISEDGETIIRVMKEQSLFGEIALMFAVPRTVSCRSAGRSTILVLTKQSFENVLLSYPKIRVAIHDIALERYSAHLQKQPVLDTAKLSNPIPDTVTIKEVQNLNIFKNMSSISLHNLLELLKPVEFKRQELIFDIQKFGLFLIKEGSVLIYDRVTMKRIVEYDSGMYFGDLRCIQNPIQVYVKCVSTRLVGFVLSMEDLEVLNSEYPYLKAKIEEEMHASIFNSSGEHTDTTSSSESIDLAPLQTLAKIRRSIGHMYESLVINASERKELIPKHVVLVTHGAIKIWKKDRSGETKVLLKNAVMNIVAQDAPMMIEAAKDFAEYILISYSSLSKLCYTSPEIFYSIISHSLSSQISIANDLDQSEISLDFQLSSNCMSIYHKLKETIPGSRSTLHSIAKIKKRLLAKFKAKLENYMDEEEHTLDDYTYVIPDRLSSRFRLPFLRPAKIKEKSKAKYMLPKSFGHISDLDLSELFIVLRDLKLSEVVKMMRTSKAMLLILSQAKFWRRVHLSQNFNIISTQIIKQVAEIASNSILDLKLDGCWQIVDNDLAMLLNSSTVLEKLSLNECRKITDRPLSGIPFNTVKCLNLGFCGIQGTFWAADEWTALKFIDLSYCRHVSEAAFESLFESAPNLEVAILSRCLKLTDFAVGVLVKFCT